MNSFLIINLFIISCLSANENMKQLLIGKPDLKKKTHKAQHALTHKVESWRRLGDNILTIVKTQIFAHELKLPFYYKEFPYCDQFHFIQTEQLLTDEIEHRYSKKITVNNAQDIIDNLSSKEPILFEVHFLTQTPSLYPYCHEHPDFGQKVKELFYPLIPIKSLPKPESVLTVAVHVRKGGGYDRPLGSLQEYDMKEMKVKGIYLKKNAPYIQTTDVWPLLWPAGLKYIEAVQNLNAKKQHFSDYTWPVKFPPDQYYIDQIKYVAQLLPEKNLLIYIFTDDPCPQNIVKRYSEALKDYNRLIFSYRQADNHHTKNVIEDLFALAQCDCLISANSSFAQVAHLLGNHRIIIFPVHALLMPDRIFINKIGAIQIDDVGKMKYEEITHKLK